MVQFHVQLHTHRAALPHSVEWKRKDVDYQDMDIYDLEQPESNMLVFVKDHIPVF